MANILIPIPDLARETGNCRMRVRLDGADYVIRLLWNSRASTWSFDLLDVDSDPIVSGGALVVWFPLLDLVTDERCPPGSLMLYNPDGTADAPTLTDLGVRSRLLYVEAA